ncbi:MAG: 16S rRNA (adenine(1518)-N(6)/adenine(1519)-N(6))-dimethyltransferase RsmA [Alphaproteobacteria bacterium]|nr:16S rRNA (adenine(1518)-N(6)/adenine(1519)-N(6))-dimethyltransferase RsmA [Alphaproteobacteria bacterium]
MEQEIVWPPLRDVLARYDLKARKALGQHFLCDMNLTRRIVACAGDLSGCTVFEVGPGPGGLTRALLESKAERVVVIEKDERFFPALQEVEAMVPGRMQLIGGDALTLDLEALAPPPRVVVANLPYNVGTELLVGWLKKIDAFRSLTLMFQAEVVDRLVAAPSSKAYGRLSVLTQFCAVPQRVMELPASVFVPPPKVASAVVRLVPRPDRPPDIPIRVLETVTAHAFGQRRKMLRSSLKPLGGEALLAQAGIDPTARAETLSLAQFEALARLVARQ